MIYFRFSLKNSNQSKSTVINSLIRTFTNLSRRRKHKELSVSGIVSKILIPRAQRPMDKNPSRVFETIPSGPAQRHRHCKQRAGRNFLPGRPFSPEGVLRESIRGVYPVNALSIKVNGQTFFSRCCLSQMPDKWLSRASTTPTNTPPRVPLPSWGKHIYMYTCVSIRVDRSVDINIGKLDIGERPGLVRLRLLANIEGG